MTTINADDMTPEQMLQDQKQNCIFCKIAKGEIPSKKVYEDPNFVGVLDINPAAEGHILIIPKEHYQIMPQLSPELVGLLGVATKKVSSMILKGIGVQGTTIFIANGYVAGQKAPHLIAHVIPRKDGDEIKLNPKIIEIIEPEYENISNKIKTGLGIVKLEPKKQVVKDNIEEIKEDIEELNEDIKEINQNLDEEENDNSENENLDEKENDNSENDESDIDLITKMFTK